MYGEGVEDAYIFDFTDVSPVSYAPSNDFRLDRGVPIRPNRLGGHGTGVG